MLRPLVGLGLAGYGLLVLLGLLPHDAPVAGAAAFVLGALLLAWGLPDVAAPRTAIVAALGVGCVAGVTLHNVAAGSDLALAERAILGYGLALLVLAPFLHVRWRRFDVASVVGWSFPLLLAPLALFALDGALADGDGGAGAPLVESTVVAPTAAALQWLGTPVERDGSTLHVATPRGNLSLGVGLVCAGLYPMVLFGGVLGVHAWRVRPPPGRLAIWAAGGLGGLWLLNLARLVVLTRVGIAQGPGDLQAVHSHLGWILFALFMGGFWWRVLRPRPIAASAKPLAAATELVPWPPSPARPRP